jgi:exonuclease V gamma subunit
MARKLSNTRLGSHKPPSHSDYRRLTAAELKRAGYGEGSKRRVLATVKKVKKATPTLTDRQYTELKLQARLGKKTSKETYRNLVQQGQLKYATKQARSAGEARFVRQFIPQIAPKHLSVILQWYEGGYKSLSPKEQERFRSVFSQYSRDAVRQALGSAPQDTGSFSIG